MSDHANYKKPGPPGGPLDFSDKWATREETTPIQLVDKLIAGLRENDPVRFDLFRLRQQIQEHELTLTEARAALEKMDEVIKKVTSPANRIGTFLGFPKKEIAHIAVGGHDYYSNVDPRLDRDGLKIGTRVLVNEAYVVVGDLGYDNSGPVGKVTDVLKDGRLRVGQEHGLHSVILQRSSDLLDANLKAGDEIRIDPAFRVAVELLASSEKQEFYLEAVPELPWTRVGGQTAAIQAFNLTGKLREKTGHDMKECFMHVKGPEILNMWVGESERIVREIFSIAREKRKQGYMPFVFIDEAESILGTRRAGRYSNILSTLVPMFCSEMDGIESLNDVVIILASNRADLIDPAILRPGRIDRKIKVDRPDKEGSREIFSIYLTEDLPIDPATLKTHGGDAKAAVAALVDSAVKTLYAHRDENRFLEVQLRSGRNAVLYRGDLISGAIIASIVERAKEMAIKRSIESKKDEGISETDLLHSLELEYTENDIFPPSDVTEDWLMLLDYDPENVVKVSPIRPRNATRAKGISSVV
jgi:proteasome-associated ATPase